MAQRMRKEQFHGNTQHAVTTMLLRVIDLIHPSFTLDEALQLFATEDDRMLLATAEHRITPVVRESSRSGFYVPAPNFTLRVAAGHRVVVSTMLPRLLPRYPAWQDDAPAELRDRYIAWLEARMQVSIDYGRLRAVVGELIEQFDTPANIRRRFPAILGIWQQHDALLPFVDQYSAPVRESRTQPFIRANYRAEAILAAETVAGYTTLPKHIDTTSKNEVQLELQPANSPITNQFGWEFMPA